jgi:hypothetical protein
MYSSYMKATSSVVWYTCDYNRNVVLQAIQDDILAFERKIRNWLILNSYDNHLLLDYFKAEYARKKDPFWKNKIDQYHRDAPKMNDFGKFQLFLFRDLLNVCASPLTNNTYNVHASGRSASGTIRQLCNLRNVAMHAKDPVGKDNAGTIYSIDDLKVLKKQVLLLKEESHRLSQMIWNHPSYQRSIELENRKKLEIIHLHHPEALSYFLGWNGW